MTTPYTERPLAPVTVDAATEHFWTQAKEGLLCTRRCTSCGEVHWYPRALCPFCMGDTEWCSLSGLGTIYSVSVTRRAGPIAYAIAYVALDEGITLLTNIVDCDFDDLKIGQRVEVTFKPAEGGAMVPMFKPAWAQCRWRRSISLWRTRSAGFASPGRRSTTRWTCRCAPTS